IKMDKKMKAFLAGKDITPEFVPAEGERIYLRRNGEFFGQRDAINVTDNLSPKIKNIAVEAVNAITGLSIGGVDMLIDLEKNEGIVNEVNSLPQISNHIFPIEGNAIDIPRIIIDSYFPETRYEELKNTHYYYDFKPIIENFRNGTAQEVTLPPIPTGKYIAKKYSVSGENFSKRYFPQIHYIFLLYIFQSGLVAMSLIPTGKYIAKKYSVSGENFSKRYFEKMK